MDKNFSKTINSIYIGKVRHIYKISNETLLIKSTNRISCFNKNIGEVPNKGILINKMTTIWFNLTKHIISNHLLFSSDDYLIVKKCIPFRIEVIVRGYMTGTTETSLWTHYNSGSRLYCGISLDDDILKNQKLNEPIVTPTTKSDVDTLISREEIIKEKYMNKEEYEFICKKAIELFKFGENLLDEIGLILVDTKYEFGKDSNGNIILIDELHTCDSSRFWIKEDYYLSFKNNTEPKKIDKDCIRDWVKLQCNPYKDKIPEIPTNIINKVENNYNLYYNLLKKVEKNS